MHILSEREHLRFEQFQRPIAKTSGRLRVFTTRKALLADRAGQGVECLKVSQAANHAPSLKFAQRDVADLELEIVILNVYQVEILKPIRWTQCKIS